MCAQNRNYLQIQHLIGIQNPVAARSCGFESHLRQSATNGDTRRQYATLGVTTRHVRPRREISLAVGPEPKPPDVRHHTPLSVIQRQMASVSVPKVCANLCALLGAGVACSCWPTQVVNRSPSRESRGRRPRGNQVSARGGCNLFRTSCVHSRVGVVGPGSSSGSRRPVHGPGPERTGYWILARTSVYRSQEERMRP